MRRIALGLASLSLVLLLVSLAPAFAIPPNIQYSADWTPSDGANLLIHQFNPALGTLNGINLSFSGEVTGTFTVNNFFQTSLLELQYGSSLSLWKPDPGPILQVNPALDVWVSAPPGVTGYGFDVSSDPVSTSLGSADFAAFLGTGTVGMPISFSTTLVNVNDEFGEWWDGGTYDATHNPSAHLNIRYLYTPRTNVPEPGSLALLGLGLPLAGVWFRRRKSA